MKKILSAMFVAMLFLGIAGQASAYFEKENLLVAVYNDDEEMLMDLGDVNDIDFTATGVVLGNLGDYISAGYTNIAFGSYVSNTYTMFYTLNTSEDASIKLNQFSSFQNSINTVYNYAENDETDVLYYSTTEDASWYNNMSYNYAGFVSEKDYSIIDLPEEDEYIDIYLYNVAMGSTVESDLYPGEEFYAVLRITSDGDIILNPVPVPGAVWMLGSALLGLVGLRKRNA